MTRHVALTRGYSALVDDADYAAVSEHAWRASGSEDRAKGLYAVTTIGGEVVAMHTLIMGERIGFRVDHRNGNGLDNRRAENLRWATALENGRNKRRRQGSGFKGVHTFRAGWQANIGVSGRTVYLGTYKSPVLAARAYDRAAAVHFGDFANLNFPARRDWLIPLETAGAWPPAPD